MLKSKFMQKDFYLLLYSTAHRTPSLPFMQKDFYLLLYSTAHRTPSLPHLNILKTWIYKQTTRHYFIQLNTSPNMGDSDAK